LISYCERHRADLEAIYQAPVITKAIEDLRLQTPTCEEEWPDTIVLAIWTFMTKYVFRIDCFTSVIYNISSVRVLLHEQKDWQFTKSGKTRQKGLTYLSGDPKLQWGGPEPEYEKWVEIAYHSGNHFDLVVAL